MLRCLKFENYEGQNFISPVLKGLESLFKKVKVEVKNDDSDEDEDDDEYDLKEQERQNSEVVLLGRVYFEISKVYLYYKDERNFQRYIKRAFKKVQSVDPLLRKRLEKVLYLKFCPTDRPKFLEKNQFIDIVSKIKNFEIRTQLEVIYETLSTVMVIECEANNQRIEDYGDAKEIFPREKYLFQKDQAIPFSGMGSNLI